MSASCRQTVTKKKKKRIVYHDTVLLMNKKAHVVLASLADERAYGMKTIVKLRKMIKQSTTHDELALLLVVALMLEYQVVVRRGKIQLFTNTQRSASASAGSGRGGGKNKITDAMRAMQSYMCFKFRKNENPSFESLSKDTALMICYHILKEQVDDIMGN